MNLFKCAVMFSLLVIPALSFANGTYVPGVVVVNSGATLAQGYYNVRYNPAVTTGQVSVSISPGSYYQIYMVDSITGSGFTCISGYATSNYSEIEAILENVAAGGNGAYISVNRNTSDNSCYNVSVSSGSAHMD